LLRMLSVLRPLSHELTHPWPPWICCISHRCVPLLKFGSAAVDQREFPLSPASRTDPLPYYKLAGGRARQLDKLASFDAHREVLQGERAFSDFARKTLSPGSTSQIHHNVTFFPISLLDTVCSCHRLPSLTHIHHSSPPFLFTARHPNSSSIGYKTIFTKFSRLGSSYILLLR